MQISEDCETESKSQNGQVRKFRISSSSSSSSDSLFSEDASDFSMPSPPDGGYGWVIVSAAFMINLISDGISFSFGILYTELLEYFGESKSLTSWVGSLFYGLCLIGGPLASALATKYGCRKVTMMGGIIAALGCFLGAFAKSIGWLCFVFGVVTGLGMSMGYVTSVVIVAFYFEDKRALATGISVCGSGLGTFLFAPLTEILINMYGWRGTMMIWSGIILNLVVCGALLRPLEFTPHQRRMKALQKFERMSRTVSFTSFSNTAKSLSRNASHTDDFDSEDGDLTEDILEICHSQVQIPTYIKEKKINIPIEVLREAKSNNNAIKAYIKNIWQDVSDDNKSNVIKKCETFVVKEGNEEKVKLMNGSVNYNADTKPKGSCLKKSATTPCGTKDPANAVKHHNKQKHVRLSNYLPLYRKDLFFRGNLTRLTPQAGQVRSTSCPELYRRRWADSDSDSSDDESDFILWKYLRFSKHVKRVLKTMFDPSILLHPLYVMFAISNFILYFWYDVPYIFMADRASENGMPETKASFLISILGIVNTVGQVLFGFIGDREVNLSLLYGFSLIACGVTVLLVPLFTEFLPLSILSGGFGFFISVNYALSTVILVEYLGLDKLSNAYGLTMLGQGVANLVGPPAAAVLRDVTESYDATFYGGGGFIILSGMILLLVPVVRRCRTKSGWEWSIANNHHLEFESEVKPSKPEEKQANTQETPCSTLLVNKDETFV